MSEIEHFMRLVENEELPRQLELVQMSRRWRKDPDWIELRDKLDSLIFSKLLAGDPLTVRRIVCLEIPAEESDDPVTAMSLADEHRRWIDGLVRDLYHLGEPYRGSSARYRLKQLVLGQEGDGGGAIVKDGWSGGFTGDLAWHEAFSRTWLLPGCIENNLVPPDYPVGPTGDRDPRWYLWH